MEYKLKMSPEKVIQKAVEAVSLAKTFVDDVEFSCEDAGRSDISFLKEILDATIKAGATTLNIPDTVGYTMPNEMGAMIKELQKFVGNRAILSVHCHNDLGLALANSLSSIENGARQVECTINGLGERAGNAALEEIVMVLKTRKDIFGKYSTNVNTKEIYPTSRLVANITGIIPQPNKAIVGKNAFAHESGIHQDGVLKNKETLADKKKEMFDDDIRAIVTSEITKIDGVFKLISMQLSDCSAGVPSAAVTIGHKGANSTDAAIGNGTMDAVFKVIDRVCGIKGELKEYKVDSVTQGKDALARVVVKVQFENSKTPVIGHGLSLDTMQASAKAYIGALNSYISMKK